MKKNPLICQDLTKNESYIGKDGFYEWNDIINIAKSTVNELEMDELITSKDTNINILSYKIKYYASMIVFHTQPLKDITYCQAYNLIVSIIVGGDFLIFGDWCLYYGLTESEFIERWKTDKELQLVWTFFDTLYNKLATLRIIDNNTLKRYESSRAAGYFLPYSERAVITDTITKNKILLERGEEIAKQLMEE